ncbi:hypothetical protein ACIGEZ_26670 [Streptomyces sp. NPDC085481]|uniref:hypothetical protein n=1 Tax=Streptomyces sp. NPDC085481 TaxID=3365727 RepID=UPI0037D20AA8
MIRNVVGSVLALAGATAAVWSPFRAWYDGRHGSDYRIEDLFGGITDADSEVIGSILLPFAFAALVTLVGIVLRSRLLVALAGVIVLGFTILWMVRVGQAEGGLAIDSGGQGLGDGVANAFGGGVLLLIGALVMSGRPQRHTTRVDRAPAHPAPDERAPDPYPAPDPDHPAPDAYPTPPSPYTGPTQTAGTPSWDREPPPPEHRA